MWTFPTCNGQNLGAVPFPLDIQKHLDDTIHSSSGGKASSLLFDWMLLYDHNQCTRGRQQELDKPGRERQTAVVINNIWSIPNNTTANKNLIQLWSNFACQITDIYASPVVPATYTKLNDKVTEAMNMVKK